MLVAMLGVVAAAASRRTRPFEVDPVRSHRQESQKSDEPSGASAGSRARRQTGLACLADELQPQAHVADVQIVAPV